MQSAKRIAALALVAWALAPAAARAADLAPIVYSIHVASFDAQVASVEATIPTEGRAVIDLMMPVWSPGFYRVEDYATRVQEFSARSADGLSRPVEQPQPNRWRVQTGGSPSVSISYRLVCKEQSVTTNWIGEDFGVFNGPATFITLVETGRRPHEVRLQLPPSWPTSASGLPPVAGGPPNTYRAPDYETLADSPILAGRLGIREFSVGDSLHQVVTAGDTGQWDGPRAARDLATLVDEVKRFWGFLPYRKYAFLYVFRQGGGGLEHKDSNLTTASSTRAGTPDGHRAWLGLSAHEYFHAFNVKRLRPIGLGPFDFEHAPRTTSLWMAEGVTSYYSGLLLRRSGLSTTEQYLASLSSQIGQLQKAPGRLLQTLEQSSAEVWSNSLSGVNPSASTVSYYGKGLVVAWVLDAHIRRLTGGARSFDDVMRLAYRRYSGATGFTPEELQATSGEIAGTDLTAWFHTALASTEELDYAEALDWYGLRFVNGWTLDAIPDATSTQQRHLRDWLDAPPGR